MKDGASAYGQKTRTAGGIDENGCVDELAFDGQGNLYIIVDFTDVIVEFSPNSVAGTDGRVHPTRIIGIQPAGGALLYPRTMTFDLAGDIYVGYSQASLRLSGIAPPSVPNIYEFSPQGQVIHSWNDGAGVLGLDLSFDQQTLYQSNGSTSLLTFNPQIEQSAVLLD